MERSEPVMHIATLHVNVMWGAKGMTPQQLRDANATSHILPVPDGEEVSGSRLDARLLRAGSTFVYFFKHQEEVHGQLGIVQPTLCGDDLPSDRWSLKLPDDRVCIRWHTLGLIFPPAGHIPALNTLLLRLDDRDAHEIEGVTSVLLRVCASREEAEAWIHEKLHGQSLRVTAADSVPLPA